MGQWTYDAYGQVVTAVQHSTLSQPHAGHKGLFFDRLDQGIADAYGSETPRLAVGADLLGYNRNRTLHCGLGRFLQRDPNATGQDVAAVIAFGGRGVILQESEFLLEALFGDGANLFSYAQSNSLLRNDPTGLDSESLFDDADDFAQEQSDAGIVAMAKINAFFRDKQLLKKIRKYESGAWAWTDLVWDRDEAILYGLVGAGFFTTNCFTASTLVTIEGGQESIECVALGQTVISTDGSEPTEDQVVEVPKDLRPFCVIQLVCERDDGVVTTMELLRPVDMIVANRLTIGAKLRAKVSDFGPDQVVTLVAISPYYGPQPRGASIVTGRFVTNTASVVSLYLDRSDEPLGVTPAHRFFSADHGTWIAARALEPGDRIRTLIGTATVRAIVPRVDNPPVYNLEVSGHHTYCVGEAQALAHNVCVSRIQGKLRREAEDAGRVVQQSLDGLVEQLNRGNMNPGIGTKAAGFGEILYARARDGARVFFRTIGRRGAEPVLEIVAKAYKGNEDRVFSLLRGMYGN